MRQFFFLQALKKIILSLSLSRLAGERKGKKERMDNQFSASNSFGVAGGVAGREGRKRKKFQLAQKLD